MFGKVQWCYEKRQVTPSSGLQANGEKSALQTSKLCYSTANINFPVLIYVLNCKRAQSLVPRGTLKKRFQSLHTTKATISSASLKKGRD